MLAEHPIKQILTDTRAYWDNERTSLNVRKNLRKVIECGTVALGAEVYASQTESKRVFHTCKSRFCTSCGQRATEAWQQEMEAILPDIPYIGITLTMPKEFRPVLQQNPHLLHDVPAMGAEAIMQWAKARYGVQLLVVVVQQTFGGFLNFVPHLHIMLSSGGLHKLTNRWIQRLHFDKRELMRAWRYALIAFLAEAHRQNVLKSSSTSRELLSMFATQYKREWNVFVSCRGPKAYWLRHDGRYIRRPPVAQHRLTRLGNNDVEYQAKDTRNDKYVSKRYTNKEFIDILIQHVPDGGRHAMRYFGLLSPRSKAQLWGGIFILLNQSKQARPLRIGWRWLILKTFGRDPLRDGHGQEMHWVGRQAPVKLV